LGGGKVGEEPRMDTDGHGCGKGSGMKYPRAADPEWADAAITFLNELAGASLDALRAGLPWVARAAQKHEGAKRACYQMDRVVKAFDAVTKAGTQADGSKQLVLFGGKGE